MRFSVLAAAVAGQLWCAAAAPTIRSSNSTLHNSTSNAVLSDPKFGPIPGEAAVYSNYTGKADVFPANYSGAVLPTASGPPGPDDEMWQNLLSAEWIIYSFYQQAVDLYSEADFVALGLPAHTYQRITEIRDNEAGHLRIFQDQISATSVKPGPCKYAFGLTSDAPELFLAMATSLEVSSMAFLTGLVLQATLDLSKSALVAVAETESRHNTWSLIDVWGENPFAGPTDTIFPYANEILDTTNVFVIPGSCPSENPIYPTPRQGLPIFTAGKGSTGITPGSYVVYDFSSSPTQPVFEPEKDYYAVFFHGLLNISMPFDTTTNSSTIPSEFEYGKGVIVALIADTPGAPTLDTVVAAPAVILEQPLAVGEALAGL